MENKYSLQQLTQYFDLYEHLTGKKPENIEVTQEFFNFYKDQLKNIAKNFGFASESKKDNKYTFRGVLLKPIVKLTS